MVFNLMENGAAAAEKMRIGSNGAIQFNNAYTFPTADGNANEILQTDGAGNITFAAAGSGSPAGADTQIQFNNAVLSVQTPTLFSIPPHRLGVGESTLRPFMLAEEPPTSWLNSCPQMLRLQLN